jgi:dihydroorotase
MSLYLNSKMTPEDIIQAKEAGIAGVKSYPAGVTTNSDSGVVDYKDYYPLFAEMERQDIVLNLHGECPSGRGIDVLNAEEKFLPTLKEIHNQFPKLRVVLVGTLLYSLNAFTFALVTIKVESTPFKSLELRPMF